MNTDNQSGEDLGDKAWELAEEGREKLEEAGEKTKEGWEKLKDKVTGDDDDLDDEEMSTEPADSI